MITISMANVRKNGVAKLVFVQGDEQTLLFKLDYHGMALESEIHSFNLGGEQERAFDVLSRLDSLSDPELPFANLMIRFANEGHGIGIVKSASPVSVMPVGWREELMARRGF